MVRLREDNKKWWSSHGGVTVRSHYYPRLEGGRDEKGLPEPARAVVIKGGCQTVAWQGRRQENKYFCLVLLLPSNFLSLHFTVWTQPKQDRGFQMCGLRRSDFQSPGRSRGWIWRGNQNPCVPSSANLSALPWNTSRIQLSLSISLITFLVQAAVSHLDNCISFYPFTRLIFLQHLWPPKILCIVCLFAFCLSLSTRV